MTYYVRQVYFTGGIIGCSRVWYPASNGSIRDVCWTYKCVTAEAAATTVLRLVSTGKDKTIRPHPDATILFRGFSSCKVAWTPGDVVVAVLTHLRSNHPVAAALLPVASDAEFGSALLHNQLVVTPRPSLSALTAEIELRGLGLAMI